MLVLIVSLISALFIYVDYRRKGSVARTILFTLIFLVGIYILYRIMRVFSWGMLFAIVFIPIYLFILRRKKR